MRLRRFVGRTLALWAALAVAAVKHGFRRTQISFVELMSLLVGGLGVLASVASTRMDRSLVDRIYRICDPLLGASERSPMRSMFRIVQRVHATTFDDFEFAIALSRDEVERLSKPDHYVGLIEEYRHQMRAGCYVSIGITYAQAGHPEALRCAEALDRFGLSYFSLMALYVRYLFHAYRSETAPIRELRPKIEYFAVRGGTTWQAEMFVPSLLVGAYLAADDTLGLRESMVRLERTASEVHSYRPTARFAHAAYLVACGRLAEAVEEYEILLPLLERGSPVEYLMALGGYARALNRLGEHERALEICAKAEASSGSFWRLSGLWASELAIQRSFAKAALGEVLEAGETLDETIAEFEATGHPLRLATLHHARASVAILAGDGATFARHLGAMHRHVSETKHPGLFAQYEALAQRGRVFVSTELDHEAPEETAARSDDEVYRSVAAHTSTDKRAEVAVQLLIERSSALAGFLYLADAPEAVAWPRDAERPAAAVEEKIARILRSFADDESSGEERTETNYETSGSRASSETDGHVLVSLMRQEPDRVALVAIVALRPGGGPLNVPPPETLEALARALTSTSVTFTITRGTSDMTKAAP